METATLTDRLFDRASQLELNSEDLRDLTGLDSATIEQLRSGEETLSASQYERLCRALAVRPGPMYRGEEDEARNSPARFRRAAGSADLGPRDFRRLSLLAEQGRILGKLSEALGIESKISEFRNTTPIQDHKKPWRQGYEIAESSRRDTVGDYEPILDLEKGLRELGVHIAYVDFHQTDLKAASLWEPGAVPVMLLNRRSETIHRVGPRRSSMAHELCHLLHDADDQQVTTCLSFEQGVTTHDQAVEKRARAFAPAYIAPRSAVREWADEQSSSERTDPRDFICELGKHWGLTFTGAAYHAKNCDLLDHDVVEHVLGEQRRQTNLEVFESSSDFPEVPPLTGESLPEVQDKASPIWRGLAAKLLDRGLKKGVISKNRAAELLTWN